MNKINTTAARGRSYQPGPFLSALPIPASDFSRQLGIEAARKLFTPAYFIAALPSQLRSAHTSLSEKLYDALAGFKLKTAAVAMHLNANDRTRLFAHLDSLLDAESWDEADAITTEASFTTLLRMILFLKGRCPGLGAASTGNFIATWTEGTNRLTVECKPDDQVRWVLVHDLDGQRESAAGDTTVRRLPEVLHPYDPPKRWFPNANKTPA
jgi:hypothetical protein